MKEVAAVAGAVAFALAGLRTPGRKGLLAFALALLILSFGAKSAPLGAAVLGCGILALTCAPHGLSPLVGAGLMVLGPAILPWVKLEGGGAFGLPLALAFSLFLGEGAKGMKGKEEPEDARWFALACSFIALGVVVWSWEIFFSGGDFLRPGPWVAPALLSCASVVGGWHRRGLGAVILTLAALLGLWLLAI